MTESSKNKVPRTLHVIKTPTHVFSRGKEPLLPGDTECLLFCGTTPDELKKKQIRCDTTHNLMPHNWTWLRTREEAFLRLKRTGYEVTMCKKCLANVTALDYIRTAAI